MESTDVTPEKKTKVQIVDAVIFASVLISSYLYQHSVNIKTLIDQEADFLNNTKLANTSFIIFNRNPKCASETIWTLLDQLARVNHFQSNSDSGKAKKSRGNAENTYLQKGEQITYVEMLQGIDNNITTPFTYTKHINFINFEEFNKTNPIYINFVRDPVDRVVSWYYYVRQSWWQMEYDEVNKKHTLKPKNHNPGLIKMSYEDCVEKKLPECLYIPGNSVHWSGMGGSHFSQISFFCGMDQECDIFENHKALQLAQRNVERYYAVVGVVEKMQESLKVLENYVPAFFKDARTVYKNMMKERRINENKSKPKTLRAVKNLVRRNFTLEMEFYHFCRQRLHKQYLSIK